MSISDWNSFPLEKTLKAYVGTTYPDFESAKKAKENEALYIKQYLKLDHNSTVVDLGPGVGYIASCISPYVKKLYCVDISQLFLDASKNNLSDHNNISYHLIKHGDLSEFKNIDAVYCVAVFIHFNIYDIVLYLTELYNILSPNGRVLFDFYDADYLDPKDDTFQRHVQRYKKNTKNLVTNINFNSSQAIKNICSSIGFTIETKREGKQPLFLATKY